MALSQSLSGWGGVFNSNTSRKTESPKICRNPFQGGVGFSTFSLITIEELRQGVAIPFRVGWGFQPSPMDCRALSGIGRNPFQGGVGFSTKVKVEIHVNGKLSQSLSGWGGVFNKAKITTSGGRFHQSQSLSGWGGVFNVFLLCPVKISSPVAIPFRVGWSFQRAPPCPPVCRKMGSHNPFQGGVGFSTGNGFWSSQDEILMSQSLSGWGGVFNNL